jgi:hypothetical protein
MPYTPNALLRFLCLNICIFKPIGGESFCGLNNDSERGTNGLQGDVSMVEKKRVGVERQGEEIEEKEDRKRRNIGKMRKKGSEKSGHRSKTKKKEWEDRQLGRKDEGKIKMKERKER